MRILLLNPNTTADLTDLMLAAGRAAAAPATELVPMTAPRGVPYIATQAEAQIGGAVALEMLAERAGQVDAAIIAAFGDPGLLGARELFDIPVVGLAEAAMLTACMMGRRFGIVTFSSALAPWFRDGVRLYGLDERCAGIFALDESFSAIAEVQDEKEEKLLALANRAVEGGSDVLVFAGAPLSGLAARLAPAPSGAGRRTGRRGREAGGDAGSPRARRPGRPAQGAHRQADARPAARPCAADRSPGVMRGTNAAGASPTG